MKPGLSAAVVTHRQCRRGPELSEYRIDSSARGTEDTCGYSIATATNASESLIGIFNNGHTIEVETEGSNSLILDGIVYELKQFHFHTPSEHRVGGSGYDMELHLVHASADGANAVISVFLNRGRDSGALAPIFAQLPNELNVRVPLDAPFNPKRFLPKSRGHYRYRGSLTTPPCTEGVQWIVISQPATVSNEDMAQFAERIHFNARLVQRKVR